MRPSEELSRKIRVLAGVEERPSRVGNPAHRAWFVGRREIAHLHSESVLDVRLPRADHAKLREDPRAVFRARPSDWVEFRIEGGADVEPALALVRTAWAAARKAADSAQGSP